jgi:hypothetical protein
MLAATGGCRAPIPTKGMAISADGSDSRKRLDLWLAEKGISPALANEASIPTKRMGIRHAEPYAEKRMTFRDLPKRHLSVV